MDKDDCIYALAKFIPDMERGFNIKIARGTFSIEPDEAAVFAKLAKKVIKNRLSKLQKTA